jgi:predicted hotdog family 3-hydroxylacyl-ACP dehydratase
MADSPVSAPLGYAEIAPLLPHAAPMVLLDRVDSWDAQTIRCSAQSHLALDNPLRQDGILSIYTGVEYAAQAQALHARLTAPSGDGALRKGFVAVASKVEAPMSDLDKQVVDLDEIAAPLDIELTQLAVNDASSLYRFSLSAAGQLLLQGELLAVLAPADE